MYNSPGTSTRVATTVTAHLVCKLTSTPSSQNCANQPNRLKQYREVSHHQQKQVNHH